ncbi:MAG: ribulose-phosphate 3-epimerase [Acidobacteriota bacterium]
MIRIAPSILSADFTRLEAELADAAAAGADLLHVDVMDGHFVPNITLGPAIVQSLKRVTDLPLDCHLMISEPQRYIAQFIAAGASMISVHVEAEAHLQRALAMIREGGAKAGVAINPATSAAVLEDLLPFCDFILVMTVNPGFGGQKFIAPVLPKLRRIADMVRNEARAIEIEVDGGIDESTAPEVVGAGATILVAGSAIFGQQDRVEALRRIRTAATNPTA